MKGPQLGWVVQSLEYTSKQKKRPTKNRADWNKLEVDADGVDKSLPCPFDMERICIFSSSSRTNQLDFLLA
eukprot:CAMPEP_0195012356 /NCGR_PEP_ID=MMETSP0326_2-20130528/11756_1 /TAXON_ID=2866 ORGANISM="Crypthecodinium cohnii, Strain Seligo" /NCGR_SAMPLE_ID=MMETSP0326_2 /ASSEMBLY_ACC=CAM_ASM_000348 /LENGTH=70 /DNA_ID=CAMNT_0040021951 /DNA_START=199 /DNA_END=407 /DNA_ORIENTATION=-